MPRETERIRTSSESLNFIEQNRRLKKSTEPLRLVNGMVYDIKFNNLQLVIKDNILYAKIYENDDEVINRLNRRGI